MYALMDTTGTDNFEWVEWMVKEREKLGWQAADLARAAELSRATISDYESRQRPNPDVRALVKISRALGHSPLWLPRLAKLIPPDTERDQAIEDIVYALEGFTAIEKKEILSYINFRKNQRGN